MSKHYIVMGDVIGSRKLDSIQLLKQFRALMAACNKKLGSSILSPYTITLGDEFQGIATTLRASLDTLLYLEETRMRKHLNFKIRFVVLCGEIETAVNKEIAYGMMGPGLTRARALLMDKRRGQSRFRFETPQKKLSDSLSRLFTAMDGIAERWKPEDYSLILDMLSNTSNEKVALKYGKDRTQIWRRRKYLLIEEYGMLRDVALDLSVDVTEKAK